MKISFSQKAEIYSKCLYEIRNINFTQREIDIIGCILHNRGKKKIASLLSISHRTVSVHTYNMVSPSKREESLINKGFGENID
jgi:DNA-binding CsgD family transcriptional regulator